MSGFAAASIGSPGTIDVESDTNFFANYDDEIIILEWSANNFDAGTVRLRPEDINTQINGEVNEPFEISIENKQSVAEYPLQNYFGQDEIRSVEIKTHEKEWGGLLSTPEEDERWDYYEDWASTNCDDLSGNGRITFYIDERREGYLNPTYYGEVYCSAFSANIEANILSIQTRQEIQEVEFNVLGEKFTLSNANADIGESKTHTVKDTVKIEWKGGYETGYNFPTATEELVAYNQENGYWIVHESRIVNDYSSYLSQVEEYPERVMEGESKAEVEQEIQQKIRYEILERFDSSEFYITGGAGDEIFERNGIGFDDGVIRLKGDRMASFPAFNVYVKADEIGYEIPSASPEIVDVPDELEIQEDQSGQIPVTVRNTGDGTGNFDVQLASCTQEFSPAGTSIGVSIDPGETRTVYLDVSFSSNADQEEVTGNCEVEVVNLQDPDDVDTSRVSLVGLQMKECDEGAQFTQIDSQGRYLIMECVDGINTEIVEQCSFGEITVSRNGEYVCVDEENVDRVKGKCERSLSIPLIGEITYTDPVCEIKDSISSMSDSVTEFLSSISMIIGVIAGVAAGVVASVLGFGLGRNKLPEAVGIDDERVKLILGIVGLAIGIAIGAFVYSLASNIIFQIISIVSLMVIFVTGQWIQILKIIIRWAISS